MVRLLLLRLCLKKKLPQFVGTILFSEFDTILANIFGWFRTKGSRLGIRLLYWGVGLLLLTQALVWAGFFRQSDFVLADYFIPWVSRPIERESAAVALEVAFSGDQVRKDSVAISTILEQLRVAGAKAVVVDYRIARWSLGRILVESRLAVLGLPPGLHFYIGGAISEGCYTLDYFAKGAGSIHALTPRIRTEEDDVVLQLIKKARGFPEDTPIKRIGNTIVFGDYKIPVGTDGSLYLDLNNQQYPSGEFQTPVYVIQDPRSGELRYRNIRWGEVDSAGLPLAEKHAHLFRDKVVFLVRTTASGFELPSPLAYGVTYAKAFECVLERDYLVQSGWLHLALSALFLFLSGLITRLLKPTYAFPLLIVVAAGSFLCGHWLFHVHRIFIELTALVVTTSLAAIVFPAVRFSHDAGQKQAETVVNCP
jgi:hypothetical protein